jgi:transcriptional regulator with XRE-family HTH domain
MKTTNLRIKELRKKLNLTQKELAKKINVSPQVVSNWERNYTSLDDEDVINLANVLQTTTDYLLGLDKKNKDDEKQTEKFIKGLVKKYSIDLNDKLDKDKLEKVIHLLFEKQDDMK